MNTIVLNKGDRSLKLPFSTDLGAWDASFFLNSSHMKSMLVSIKRDVLLYDDIMG
jgi:hypothetical protein